MRAASGASVADVAAYAYFGAVASSIVGFGALLGSVVGAQALGDATLTRGLWFGSFAILHISLLPLALAQALYAIALVRTGALPRWNGWLGALAALGTLAAIPAAYGGTGFYSVVGLSSVALADVPGLAWNLGAAISMIRRAAA